MKKQNKQPQSLARRFGELFDYLIERRAYLLRTGLSQKSEYRMRQLMAKFGPYKGYQWTDRGAARFLWFHFAELRQLVPGREEQIMNRLENLWMAAKNFFIVENQNQPSCKQLSAF